VQHGVTLLFPEIVVLDAEQMNGLLEHKDFLIQQGVEFDILSDEKIVVRSAPPQLKNVAIAEFIREVAAFIHEHATLDAKLLGTTLHEHIHAQLACKTAIKAGDVLSHEQMKKLIEDLEHVDNRFICVHGRPTMWRIEKSEFEKKFRRT
jgi:DNA mismatch repair protein MutL